MKIIKVCLLLVLCISLSCKKDPDKINLWFGPTFQDKTYRDSVSCIKIQYSDYSDFRNGDGLENPTLYKYSITTDLVTDDYGAEYIKYFGHLSLDIGHTYVLKKFDLVDKKGNILYFLPWKSDTIQTDGEIPRLPFIFKATGRISFGVVRYPGK